MTAKNVFKLAAIYQNAYSVQFAAKFMRENGVPLAVARNFLLFGTK